MGPEAQWRQALGEGRFMLQRARGSGACFFPPRTAEPGTGDTDWEWIEASGEGAVYSVTIVHPRPPEAPYNVVLVDLAEGPRMMGRVTGDDAVGIGMAVRARIDTSAGEPIVLFDPA
jgi:uncharacterized OB-fold protein